MAISKRQFVKTRHSRIGGRPSNSPGETLFETRIFNNPEYVDALNEAEKHQSEADKLIVSYGLSNEYNQTIIDASNKATLAWRIATNILLELLKQQK